MELWDAYSKEEKLTGDRLVRGEEIPPGLYHLVCEVLRHGTSSRHHHLGGVGEN